MALKKLWLWNFCYFSEIYPRTESKARAQRACKTFLGGSWVCTERWLANSWFGFRKESIIMNIFLHSKILTSALRCCTEFHFWNKPKKNRRSEDLQRYMGVVFTRSKYSCAVSDLHLEVIDQIVKIAHSKFLTSLPSSKLEISTWKLH